jgi:hypothetical protein
MKYNNFLGSGFEARDSRLEARGSGCEGAEGSFNIMSVGSYVER